MKAQLVTFLFLLSSSLATFAQDTGTIKGKVVDEISQEPIPFANVVVQGSQLGSATDIDGNFQINKVPFGYQKLEVSAVGYAPKTSTDVLVTKANTPYIEIGLSATATQLKEVVVQTSKFKKTEESPVSLQTLGVEEIERNPGGNRDISRVIQSLPGVASTTSFRNDIIIRGGAPNENRFYLDGVEVPVINHFQTQGSSGGPVGIINVNFIREVDFYSGAFPANRGNALSSVLEFKQKDGNKEDWKFRGTLGSSDVGLTADGPIGENTTFIGSIRRSYLQFLFQALRLPFLPTFTDSQFKLKHKINDKNQITFIGLGAYDEFRLNESVNDGIDDPEELERNNFILGNIPVNEQWNYTVGAVYKHFGKNSFQTLVASRNHLNNQSFKYEGNDDSSEENLIQDYNSTEIENKLRFENDSRFGSYKLNIGANLEQAIYTNSTFLRRATLAGPQVTDFTSEIDLVRYGLFGQISRPVLDNRLTLSLGFRLDGNSFSEDMSNPLDQFSPRFSASYSITDRWSINFNTGRYFQLPPFTVLGFRNSEGDLVNKENEVKYIQSDHIVGGVQFNPTNSTKITVEGFFKDYSQYPFSLTDSISLANLGADFGVIGNESVASISEGRSYGVEFLAQKRSTSGWYGIVAYTLVRSEFKDKNGDYISSSWDSRHIVSLTGGRKFKKNWELGLRWRFVDGQPFTPFDVQASALRTNWDLRGNALPNYNLLNTQRVPAFHQLDIRVDKVWYFKKWSLNLYLDIQNLYNFQAQEQDILLPETNSNGDFVIDSEDTDRYEMKTLPNTAGNVLPTIGVIVDF